MKAYFVLVLVFAIPALEVMRRYLLIRKFRALFPDRVYRLSPPFFEITFDQVPLSKDGEKYRAYYRGIIRITLISMILCGTIIYLIGNWSAFF